MDISNLRSKYRDKSDLLLEKDIVKEPITLFSQWLEDALNDSKIIEPNAMCLSTCTKDGIVSARFVLCKGFDKEGFKFFTHYTSRKGQEIEENPNVALTFFWASLSKSIRIEGEAEKLPMIEAETYFSHRPYNSQIGALCSNQSKVIGGRGVLEKAEKDLKSKYKEGEVPKPEQWGGYLVKPRSIEFWHGQSDRIHDRIRFRKPLTDEVPDNILTHEGTDGWVYERLAP